MVKVRNSFVTKMCSVLLCLSMLIGMIPTGIVAVFAASDEGDSGTSSAELGTLSTITAGGSVTDANGENAVAAFDGATVTWATADPAVGRYSDGWWVGVKMTAPETLTKESDFVENGVDKVTYRRRSNGSWTEAMSFWNAQDSDKNAVETERFLTMWVLVNAQYLNQALADDKPITYSYAFNWNGDDEFEQNVTIQVNPNTILKKGEETVYPSTDGKGTVSTLSAGLAVQGDANDNYVQVTYASPVVLDWAKADPSIFRNSDGWWAGIKVTVPEEITLSAEDDIKYQSSTADGWSAEKSMWTYKDSEDEATEHFITLWGLLNEEKLADAEQNNKSVRQMWRFDWDKDGSYEQTVSLEMAPEYITLVDENGVRVFPKFGEVETISGGTVVENGTNNIEVNASDLTLGWSDINQSIGRYQAGWWAGIQITAPEGILVTADSDVMYQSKVGSADWSAVKSFYNNQDSAQDATVHYMQLWTVLDRAMVEAAIEANEQITAQWRFDWNKDDSYEQLVTFNIDPTTVTLTRVDRTDFTFEETASDKKVWIGDGTYTVEAFSTLAPGTVTYAIDPSSTGNATVDANTGVITLKGIGSITVNATIAEDDVYNAKTISFTFEVVKKQLEGISFEVENPAAVTFGDDVEANTVKDFESVGMIGEIQYEIVEQKKLDESDSEPAADAPVAEIDPATGKLTIYRSGIITVKATLINDQFEAESATYTLTINKAEQSVDFTEDAPDELTFSTEPYENTWITKPDAENATVVYSIAETDDIAEVVEGNKILTKKAGTFTLTITVSGDDCYIEKSRTKEMKVVRATQSSFVPSEENVNTITYNGPDTMYKFIVNEGESSAKTVTYKVTSDPAIADFEDPSSPILSIYKFGEVTIEATSTGDDQYADTTIPYSLTVVRGQKDITLADGVEVVKTYGIKKYTNTVTNALEGEVYVYSIEANGFGAGINDRTGEITFGDYTDPDFDEKVATVTVTREENEYYTENTVTYTIGLEYLATPEAPYVIDKEVNGNGWYNGDITISAPEGYTISYNNQHTTDDWSDSVLYDVEGTTARDIYLKNADGYMTDAIELTGYQMDKTPPVNLTIDYKVSIWENILKNLFGLDAEKATVTLKADDAVSGIDYIEYTTDNWATVTTIEDFDGSYELVIDYQYRGSVEFRATDMAGHSTECKTGESSGITVTDKNNNSTDCDDGITIVVDKIAPSLEVEYTSNEAQKEINSIIYVNDVVTVNLKLTADNFDLSDAPVVTVNDTEMDVDWTTEGTLNTVSFELSDPGDYVVAVKFTDRLGRNVVPYEKEIRFDVTQPTISVEFDPQEATAHEKYYDSERKATITIEEHNFRADEVVASITAKDLLGNDVEIEDFAEYLADAENWTHNGDDTHTASITFTEDANYTFSIDYKDIIGNPSDTYKAADFVVDKSGPVEVTVDYDQNFIEKILSTIFFYNADPTVKISAKDESSEIDYFRIQVKTDGSENATNVELPENLEIYADGNIKSGSTGFIEEISSITTGNVYEISFKVPAQFRGEFVVTAFNMAHKESDTLDDSNIVVVDSVSPKVDISYEGTLEDKIEKDDDEITRQTVTNMDANTRFVYSDDITATISVNEANFYEEMVIIVYRDGKIVTDFEESEWVQTEGTDVYVKTIKLSVEGDYQIELEYADKSDNGMDYNASGEYNDKVAEKVGRYFSNIHTIDRTAPKYEITYDNNSVVQTINGREYYGANRTATIKVEDRNFRPNEVEFTVKAADVTGADVEVFTYSDLTAWSDWTQVEENVWTAIVPFATDANYTFDFTYTDIAGNKVAEDYSKQFTVDKVAPKNLTIEYVEPTLAEKVIEAITFGFYKVPVTVEISATDDIGGVDHFVYSYVKSNGVSDVNAELLDRVISNAKIVYEGNKATATFVIPDEVLTEVNQFRGTVEFTAFDCSENNDDTKDSKVVVVDSIAPEIEITYTANSADTAVRYVDSNANDVADFNGATQAYYNGNVTATIVVDEANFFEGKHSSEGTVHEIGILLTKTDNNGVVTKTEYLPAGSAQMFASETTATKDIVWTSEGDIHTFKIEYTDDADYVLTVEYVDFSTNEADITANDGNSAAKLYNSKIVTIDKIDPVIKVDYSNTDVKNTIEGRKYYDKEQVATITVTEHNFRADDVDVQVIAQNVVGADVAVADFDAQLRNRANWKHYDSNGKEVEDAVDGNVHVATITYSVDANYTFDIACSDLADRNATDYAEDLFTVDKTATVNLTVSYSEPKIWDEILEDITFGFYNAQMTVTITAEDDTSGVYHFAYSYLKSEGVSDVNAEIIDEAIQHADIDYNGTVATATFTVPKLVLKDDNQFNGKVVFTAYDRSENNTEMSDEERVIVVDNIKPTSELSFNEPVQKVADVSYYDGDINATVVINEANFYSEDVNVTVTKDGEDYPVTVNWTDSSVDVHVGTFTLIEDGDYTVNVMYTDRSTNEMTPLVSNVLTIDTVDPVITVSGIMHQSANNQETIGFTVSVTDTNIALENFKPILSAVVKKENGTNSFTYESMAIDLGEAKTTTNENGEMVHQYTVSNLEVDGFYSLVCTAVDYADRSVSLINSADNAGDNVAVETLNYSVNRGGSVFWIETEHNDIYTGEVFKDLLNGAYANDKVTIKLHEINVDKVDENPDKKTVFTLNDGSESRDIVLTEQSGEEGNYAKNVSVGSGGWYESIYTLDNSNFDHDGVYSINVITYDKAENSNVNTKTEAGNISFTLDRTKPVITSNVTTDQRINDAEFFVEFKITETNLDSQTIVVKLTDRNGKTVETTVEELGNNEYQFLVKDGLNYTIEIVAKDLAGNESEFYKVERFTVSTNIFVLWYANTPLFWGSIGGAVLLAGAVVLLVVLKKKKKEEDNK